MAVWAVRLKATEVRVIFWGAVEWGGGGREQPY